MKTALNWVSITKILYFNKGGQGRKFAFNNWLAGTPIVFALPLTRVKENHQRTATPQRGKLQFIIKGHFSIFLWCLSIKLSTWLITFSNSQQLKRLQFHKMRLFAGAGAETYNRHALMAPTTVKKVNLQLVEVGQPLLMAERPRFLPMQFILSSGMFWTKYSRFSELMVHIGRFFCVISSSRFFSSLRRVGNQMSSHEQINGLSVEAKSLGQVTGTSQ